MAGKADSARTILYALGANLAIAVGLHEARKAQGGRTLWRWFRESRQSELVAILGEEPSTAPGWRCAPGFPKSSGFFFEPDVTD